MGYSKSSSKREVYSNTILPQEIRKTLNRQPNFTPKTAGKRRTKTQSYQKEKKCKKNGNPLQCSCLENPRDGGAWWAAIYGVTQSEVGGHD